MRLADVAQRAVVDENQVIVRRGHQRDANLRLVAFSRQLHWHAGLVIEPGRHERGKLLVHMLDDYDRRMQVERQPGWEVCGEAEDRRKAVALAETLQPKVLDLGMSGLNGLETARQIRRALPNTEVLIFTGEENEQLIHAVFEAGARSYILKADTQHLVAAIAALGQHKHYFTTRISEPPSVKPRKH